MQFVLLARRVGAAMAAGRKAHRLKSLLGVEDNACQLGVPEDVCRDAQAWRQTVDYSVVPLWVQVPILGIIAALLPGDVRQVVPRGLSRGLENSSPVTLAAKKIANIVPCFVGGLPIEAYSVSHIDSKDMRAVGTRRRRRSKKTPALDHVEWVVGDVVVDKVGRLVRVVRVRRRVAVEQITACIVKHAWFSVGNGSSQSYCAWHAARLAHRCSLLFPPEAPCERIGSLLRLYWDPRRNLGPVDMADLVLLSQAGVRCTGSQRGELVVEEVVALLKATSKYGSRGGSQTPFLVHEQEQMLAESGRFAGQAMMSMPELAALDELRDAGWEGRRAYFRKRRKIGIPVDLPGAAVRGLESGRVGNLIIPLPVDVQTLHSRQRGATGSVLKEKTRSWLESEAGQEWQRERLMLFSAGEATGAKDATGARGSKD